MIEHVPHGRRLLGILAALIVCFVSGPVFAECRVDKFSALFDRAQVHLPTIPPSTPVPLIILLHGSTGTGAGALRDSHLADTASRHGFVVVAPNGAIEADGGYVWNIPGVPTVTGAMPPKGARDDVAYITGLIDRLVGTGCIDGT